MKTRKTSFENVTETKNKLCSEGKSMAFTSLPYVAQMSKMFSLHVLGHWVQEVWTHTGLI